MVCEGSQPSVAVDFSDPTHHHIPHTHSVNMFTDTFPILNQCTHCIQKPKQFFLGYICAIVKLNCNRVDSFQKVTKVINHIAAECTTSYRSH